MLYVSLYRYNGILGESSTNSKQVEQTFAKRWFLTQTMNDWTSIIVDDPDSDNEPPNKVKLGDLFKREDHKLTTEQLELVSSLTARNTKSTLENHEEIETDIDVVSPQTSAYIQHLADSSINPLQGEDAFRIEAKIRQKTNYEISVLPSEPKAPKKLSDRGCIELANAFDPRNGHSVVHAQRAAFRHNIVILSQAHLLNYVLTGKKHIFTMVFTQPDNISFLTKSNGNDPPAIFKLSSLSKLILHRLQMPSNEIGIWPHESPNYKVWFIARTFEYYARITIGMEKYESVTMHKGIRSNVLVVNHCRDNHRSVKRSLDQGRNNLMEKYPNHVPINSEPVYHPAICWGFVRVQYNANEVDEKKGENLANLQHAELNHNMLETVFALCEFYQAHDERLTWNWAPLAELWKSKPVDWQLNRNLTEESVEEQGYWHLVPIAQLAGKFTAHKFNDDERKSTVLANTREKT
jgi:hypothetical protein